MNRGVNRHDVFFDDADRVDFGVVLADAHERTELGIHAYCLMPNHFHLLVRGRGEQLISFMHLVGTTYTRHVNDRHGRDGPLFRGRFRSVPVETDSHLVQALRYIHLNPLALVGADRLERYRWSSHRAYLGARRPLDWLSLDLLGRFPSRDDYRRFVLGAIDPAIASETLAGLIHSIVDEHCADGERPSALGRAVSLLLADLHPSSAPSLSTMTSDLTPGSLRNARSRARRRFDADPTFRAMVTDAARLLSSVGSDPSDDGPSDDGQAERSSPARSWAA